MYIQATTLKATDAHLSECATPKGSVTGSEGSLNEASSRVPVVSVTVSSMSAFLPSLSHVHLFSREPRSSPPHTFLTSLTFLIHVPPSAHLTPRLPPLHPRPPPLSLLKAHAKTPPDEDDEDDEDGADIETVFKNKTIQLQATEYKVQEFDRMGHTDLPTLALVQGHREHAWKLKAEAEAARAKLHAKHTAHELADAAGATSPDAEDATCNKRKPGADDDDGRYGEGSVGTYTLARSDARTSRSRPVRVGLWTRRSSVSTGLGVSPSNTKGCGKGLIIRQQTAIAAIEAVGNLEAVVHNNVVAEANILLAMGERGDRLEAALEKLHKSSSKMEAWQECANDVVGSLMPGCLGRLSAERE